MNFQEKLNDLDTRRNRIELQGGQEAIDQMHTMGKKSARERIELLFDENSFVEIGAFIQQRATDFNLNTKDVPADGVVTGYGTIEGRLAYAYSQDSTLLGGSVGEMHAKKIVTLYDLAIKMGAPLIGLVDSAGLRLQESTDALDAVGQIYVKQSIASGVIPQITGILGPCGGGSALVAGLSDFTFMSNKNGHLFVNSPNTYSDTKKNESFGTARYNSEISGLVDCVYDDEQGLIQDIRHLVELLPANNAEEAPFENVNDDLNRLSPELNSVISSQGFNSRSTLQSICDQNNIFEIKQNYGTEVIIAFGKMNGMTVGFIGNQTNEGDGRLTVQAMKKITKFVTFCDAFNIPIVTISDVIGYAANSSDENQGLARVAAKMTHAFIQASVPKINVITYRAFGSAYVSFNSKHLGADVVLAWPTAEIGVMEASSAVRIMYNDEITDGTLTNAEKSNKESEYKEKQSSPYVAASRGYIDDVIEPAATRKRVIVALEMLYTKRVPSIDRKHSTI